MSTLLKQEKTSDAAGNQHGNAVPSVGGCVALVGCARTGRDNAIGTGSFRASRIESLGTAISANREEPVKKKLMSQTGIPIEAGVPTFH